MIRIYLVCSKDSSLCQFCVDSAFGRNEGEFNLIIDPLPHVVDLIRWCWPNELET